MIQKIFSTLILVVALSFPGGASAQTQCSDITPANFDECCVGANAGINNDICSQYVPPPSCTTVTQDNFDSCCPNPRTFSRQCNNYLTGVTTIEGVLGSGSQSTTPQNGGVSTSTSATVGTSPQSSAAALKTCSAIRFNSLLDILIWLKCIISAAVIPLIFVFAFVLFLRGVLVFMRDGANEKKKEDSKKLMYYGIIGLVVMTGVWGIVNIVNTTFGFGNTVPQLQINCLTTDKNNPCK